MAFPFAGVGSILSGLGGLFGSSKPKKVDIADNIRDQAWGARQAAEKFGFNPLTMLQMGQPAGGGMYGGGGPPPLASVQAITGGLQDVQSELSGEADRLRAADELNLDLAKVKLDQARAELKHLNDGAVFGRRAAPVPVYAGASPVGHASISRASGRPAPKATDAMKAESPIAPDRAKEVLPVSNTGGVFEINNRATSGKNVWIPGDGEPWGIDEAATALIVGVPQVLGGLANDYVFDGKRVDEFVSDQKKKAEELKDERDPDPFKPDWETGNFPQSPFYR